MEQIPEEKSTRHIWEKAAGHNLSIQPTGRKRSAKLTLRPVADLIVMCAMKTRHKNRKPRENRTRIQDMKPFSELCRSLIDDPATIKRVAIGINKIGNVRTGCQAGPP